MWLWALLPVSLAVFGTAGIWTVFAIATSNGSVNLTEEFPYISKCGSYNPQSCIFAQICNICAVLAMWIVVIRFQQVRDFGSHGNIHRVNNASITLGFISSVGISVIGNFQQSVLKQVHLLGAFLAFFMGLAYFWLQLFLSYKSTPSQDRRWVGAIRALLCVLCTILVLAMVVLHNTGLRSAAAVCEWVLVMLFFCHFGLFADEFRHVDCHVLTVQTPARWKNHNRDTTGTNRCEGNTQT